MNYQNLSENFGKKFSISLDYSELGELLKQFLTGFQFLMLTARQCVIIFQATPETWQQLCRNAFPQSTKN